MRSDISCRDKRERNTSYRQVSFGYLIKSPTFSKYRTIKFDDIQTCSLKSIVNVRLYNIYIYIKQVQFIFVQLHDVDEEHAE